MSEPIYEFIPGKGWVAGPPGETFYVVFRDGKTALAEFRIPEPHEFGSWHWASVEKTFWIDWAKEVQSKLLDRGDDILAVPSEGIKWVTFTML